MSRLSERITWLTSLLLILMIRGATVASAMPSIEEVRIISGPVKTFEKLEISFQLKGRFSNPFDPNQIQSDGYFTSPDGKEIVMPAFYHQEFQRTVGNVGRYSIEKKGGPGWRIRFCPGMQGPWIVKVCARDREGSACSNAMRFEVQQVKAKGFIRRGLDYRYFSYEDDSPFFIVGENMAWPMRNGIADYDEWLSIAGRSGINLVRIWLQWNDAFQIEHKETGPGRYDLVNAWRMDYALDTARRNGVRVFFTMDSPDPYQRELPRETGVKKPWINCPYNIDNGGPLRDPIEFFSSDEARRLIRNRMRYIVARWGWDPNIFCWELWNELNTYKGFDDNLMQITQWHAEMIGFLHKIDVNHHLISTSFANIEGPADIWELDGIDFTQSHSYRDFDMAGTLPPIASFMVERYRKPHIFGEFGPPTNHLKTLFKTDPVGIYIRNAIWSTVLSGGSGTPLTWGWDNHVHRNNLYHLYTSLSKFLKEIPWSSAGFKPAKAEVSWRFPDNSRELRDLVLTSHGNKKISGEVIIDPASPPSIFGPIYLEGKAHPEKQKPVVLKVKRSVAGPVIFHVSHVSVSSILQIKLDGNLVYANQFQAGPGAGQWIRSEYDSEWRVWSAYYDTKVEIRIPEGEHAIELFNAGQDRLTIDRLTLPDYIIDIKPNLRVIGLTGNGITLLWIQNADHHLASVMDGRRIVPIDEAVLTLKSIPPATYEVQWWDTERGEVIETRTIRAKDMGLVIELPSIKSDIACKIVNKL